MLVDMGIKATHADGTTPAWSDQDVIKDELGRKKHLIKRPKTLSSAVRQQKELSLTP